MDIKGTVHQPNKFRLFAEFCLDERCGKFHLIISNMIIFLAKVSSLKMNQVILRSVSRSLTGVCSSSSVKNALTTNTRAIMDLYFSKKF